MNLKQHLKEKNAYLRTAYKAAYEYHPSSPLSVSLDPRKLGKSLGYDAITTERIVTELVDDGYATSSIGMGILMVTNAGLTYLREIEDEPMAASAQAGITDLSLTKGDLKTPFMKQSEKLDLILKTLYKFKNDGKFYSLTWICESLNIPIDSVLELNKLGHRLQNDGYINTMFTRNDCNAELTTYGIDYCEENSYSYSGHPIITNNYSISITNSPNSNIVNQSSNVAITQNISEVNKAIENIRETIATDTSIDRQKATDILDCLNEIQDSLRNNKKPKFAIKALIDVASGISSIGSWVTTLGQFAGIIPILGQ